MNNILINEITNSCNNTLVKLLETENLKPGDIYYLIWCVYDAGFKKFKSKIITKLINFYKICLKISLKEYIYDELKRSNYIPDKYKLEVILMSKLDREITCA